MSTLNIKPANTCHYDLISLGEVMLRLDPGEGRIHTTRTFRVWEGGGEYNVARGLRRCFGLRTAVVTAFADNAVGRLVEDFILQGGVDVSQEISEELFEKSENQDEVTDAGTDSTEENE